MCTCLTYMCTFVKTHLYYQHMDFYESLPLPIMPRDLSVLREPTDFQ